MNFEDLTPEQKEKARACKTSEEVFALIQEEGLELTDEELEAASGGSVCWTKCWCYDPNEPKCSKKSCLEIGW